MSCQVYYRKWRPQTLGEVVGQAPITTTLLSALRQRRMAQAYLFCGPRGTGKTSTGRILAKAVNCLTNEGLGEPCNTCDMCRAITEGRAMDIIEIDAASNTGVEDIRELKERANYSPAEARYKVYIIDEVHMLSTSASNALLKTLEEPPPQVIFVLATTELHKILPTIMSRCQRFDFRRLSTTDIAAKLSEIALAEGVDIDADGVALLARASGGSLRDAENLLQQIATVNLSNITLRQVQSGLGLTGDDRSNRLINHLIAKDASAGMRLISEIAADGVDLKQFNRELVEKLHHLLMVKAGAAGAVGLTAEELSEAKSNAATATIEHIMAALKGFTALFNGADMTSPLAMEMALIDVTNKPGPATAAPEIAKSTQDKPLSIESSPPKIQAQPISPVIQKPAPAVTTTVPETTVVASIEAQEQSPRKPPAELNASPIKTLDELVAQWPQILTAAPPQLRRSSALAILRSAGVQPVAFENGMVTLCFKFPIHMNKINEIENKKVTSEILSSCLGITCQVNCIHEAPSNHLVKEAQRRGAEIISVEDKWTSQG
ncbi:DNA polymerase III subunits gamma and tau [Dehalogenimonas sp. WBC-2]|nr:DNA polymerase III subunits gamma and tau [Dehalogenimonas sp. WBC-2]